MLSIPALDRRVINTSPKHLVRGKWCAVRLTPNLRGEELINIGVAFKTTRGKLSFRLLPSLQGFRAIYGENGVDNLEFLRMLLEDETHETHTLPLPEISPHLTYGPWKPAQGVSVDKILESMFQEVVTLKMRNEHAGGLGRTVGTRDLRKSIFHDLEKTGVQVKQILHEQRVKVSQGNRDVFLDLPIWREKDLFRSDMYGSIVSTRYVNDVYRQHDLDSAFRNLNIARQFFAAPESRGGLFILKPEPDEGFPIRDIENDIDEIAWPLEKQGIKVECGTTHHVMQAQVSGFLLAASSPGR